MDNALPPQTTAWPAWKKIIFRFFFVYLALQISPWTWLDEVPGVVYVTRWYTWCMEWLVNKANTYVFHVKQQLVPTNGSGDTSFGWAELWTMLGLAFIGCVIWGVLDRRRRNYVHLNYWLCLFARYYVAYIAFIYGILKLFAMQMYFPSLHQLATPLGDFLPMRLSWMFIGYSAPYQVFSGIMETFAGLLLLYRKTATMGILVATAVFINVMMLNLCYDIPVKIFSMQMVVTCLFLLASESNRIVCFFILNKPAAACSLYHFTYPKKWMRITRVVFKLGFIVLAIGLQAYNDKNYYQYAHTPPAKQPVKNGVYDVAVFAVNKHEMPLSLSDSMRWQDLIFENGSGSIKTADSAFHHRYQRAYFAYSLDSASNRLFFKAQQYDSLPILSFAYQVPDSNTIKLWGVQRGDSLYVELKRTNKHFQLAEKQFHWLSEANR